MCIYQFERCFWFPCIHTPMYVYTDVCIHPSLYTVTTGDCWMPISLHPIQVRYSILLRVRLTVFSSVYFSVNCLFRFYTYFSIKFVFWFIETLYIFKGTFCDLGSNIFSGLSFDFLYWDFFFPHVNRFISSWDILLFWGISATVLVFFLKLPHSKLMKSFTHSFF